MTLVYRSEKGSALTYTEMDDNFRGLANGAFVDATATITANTINANVLNGSGAIVQQKFVKIGPAEQIISSTVPVKITGLELAITPKYSDSIISVEAFIATDATYVSSYAVYKNGSPTVTVSTDNSNYPNMQITLYNGGTTSTYMHSIPVYHFETSGNTTSRTYAIYAVSAWGATAAALHINNRTQLDMASVSYMTVKEIRP
jgi:hypothetical protein